MTMDKLKDEIEDAFGISPGAIARRQAKRGQKNITGDCNEDCKTIRYTPARRGRARKIRRRILRPVHLQRDYWEKLAAEVGDAPSALDLIFPEVYLEDGDAEARIEKINAAMGDYLERGSVPHPEGQLRAGQA